MTNQYKEVLKVLDLPQADYFSFDDKSQGKLQDALEEIIEDQPDEKRAGIAMIALGGPDLVDLNKKKSLPLIIGSLQSGLREWQVYYPTNLHIFVKNHSTGALWAFEPLVSMRRGKQHLKSGVGEPPDETESQTISSAVKWIDLLQHSQGQISQGLISVIAIADTLISNTKSMHLTNSDQKSDVKQNVTAPHYLQAKAYKKPTLSDQVSVPASASITGTIPIKVAVQVDNENDIVHSKKDGSFLSAHIILVKLDERPEIIPATVPVQKVITSAGAAAFNAVFQIDLKAASKNPLIGRYNIYLDSGKDFLGPYPIEITK